MFSTGFSHRHTITLISYHKGKVTVCASNPLSISGVYDTNRGHSLRSIGSLLLNLNVVSVALTLYEVFVEDLL